MEENDLHFMVGEIRSDVKTLLAMRADHEERITSLERWRWVSYGFYTCCAFVAVKLGLPAWFPG